jgi:hypothetical protein
LIKSTPSRPFRLRYEPPPPRISLVCKDLGSLQFACKTWHPRCIVPGVCQASGPAKKNGGNKNMAKKILKKAKKLEATKPLTLAVR